MTNTLILVQDWLDRAELGRDGRLPAERTLAAALAVSRGELRKALASLEEAGRLTRHVGRGTFLARAAPAALTPLRGGLADAISPREADEARAVLEPALARLAARNGSARQIEAVRAVTLELREAASWGRYDEDDTRLHRLVAEAAANGLLLALHDLMSEVRRSLSWGCLADRSGHPSRDDPSHAEHDALATALGNRDADAAAEAARHHALRTGTTTRA